MPASGYASRPDYRVDLLPRRNVVQARAGSVVLATSRRTIVVDEQDHALVFYFPRSDVAMDRLAAMADRRTTCPYKGDASYWALAGGGGEPVAWSYEAPHVQVGALAGYIAFYQDRVDIRVGGEAMPGGA